VWRHAWGDGARCSAPAAQNLGVGLLVTALDYLHVRYLEQRFDGLDSTTFSPMALRDYTQLFQRGGLQSPATTTQIPEFYVQPSSKNQLNPPVVYRLL
jgi:hypothetical protein